MKNPRAHPFLRASCALREDLLPLRRMPPASDNIEIDDKHLRERFVTQKTYLDHCAQSYNRAVDYGFKGPSRPGEAHCLALSFP